MATSGTTDFDISVEEVIQEAYERCGLTTSSGYDLKTARRSLNILFLSGVTVAFIYGKLNLKNNF